jgi:hypothetical protein
LPPDIPEEKVDIWFQDEARVGQQGTLTRCWARKGTRPRLKRQRQYESAYLFGAVCPAKDKSVGIVMPKVNIFSMQTHLDLISKKIPVGRYAVIVLDRAGWHTSSKLKNYHNIFLMPLPAASPELNPTEQVWQQLRDRYFANRSYENYDDIVDNCCYAWNDFTKQKNNIRKFCSRDWATLVL